MYKPGGGRGGLGCRLTDGDQHRKNDRYWFQCNQKQDSVMALDHVRRWMCLRGAQLRADKTETLAKASEMYLCFQILDYCGCDFSLQRLY